MIYIFGQGKDISIIFDDSTLTQQDKTNGLTFESIPEAENRDGFIARLALDENNNPYWWYEEIVEEQ